MKKIKEYLKEIRSDKRKKGLFSLGLWFIFFVIVFLLLGNPRDSYENYYKQQEKLNESNVVLSSNTLDNYKNMSNYEFSYNINILQNNISSNYVVNGTYFDNKYYFVIDNNNYYLKDNNIYLVDNSNKSLKKLNNLNINIININSILKDSVYNMINSSELLSSKGYNDGSTIKDYLYKTSNGKTININTTEKDKLINKIVIDYKNYYEIYQTFIVNIGLNNINNISEYNVNYDSYNIIEEGV